MSRATQNPEGELNKSERGSGDGSAFHSVDARFDTLPLFYDLKKIIILKYIRLWTNVTYLNVRFKQISKHYFTLNKVSPYHTTITCSWNFRRLTSDEMKPARRPSYNFCFLNKFDPKLHSCVLRRSVIKYLKNGIST